jgi:uncharacterized RDD family membrane protein YckC
VDDIEDIRATVAGLPDAELLAIAKVDCGNRPTPTLRAAYEELARRGVPVPPPSVPFQAEASQAGHNVPDEPSYGGFWRRFGASWLDVLFLLPLGILTLWFSARTRYAQLWMLGPGLVVWFIYNVYLVRQFSGTPGKVFLNLRILRVDGTRIGYREAVLRHVVDLTLGQAQGIALALAAIRIPDAEYSTLTFGTRMLRLRADAPDWYRLVSALGQLWFWSEFIVMMTNHKRRALHDFLAGTVVIYEGRAVQNQTLAEPPPIPAVMQPSPDGTP